MIRILATVVGLVLGVPLALGHGPSPLAPGYGELGYAVPTPGSYRLPPLGDAADGQVLDTRGNPRSLHELYNGRVVVLSFIYRSCDDVNGCPLAATVLHRIRQATAKDATLARTLRLISLSFDPERDTPEQMGRFAEGFHFSERGAEWLFLTSASQEMLAPILDAYGQSVLRESGADGGESGAFAHVLRVFLIDRRGRIRNIYSPSFLHPSLVLNDVRTLLMEETRSPAVGVTVSAATGPGDNRVGHETQGDVARSLSLDADRGQALDLMAYLSSPPLGLPPTPVPEDTPVTAEQVALGRKLFFDRRLSLNGTFSCAMCHIPDQGFTSNELQTAVGIEGRSVRRNTPTLYNVGYANLLFHDGRETRLEHQTWGPLLAPNEMGNPSIASVIGKLQRLPDYQDLFETAFGRGPDMETVGMALASYQRTLNAADSPFDRWYFGGEPDAVNAAVKRGFAVFMGKGRCSCCHAVGSKSALFTDHKLHNTGVGYRESMEREPPRRRVQMAPGVALDLDVELIRSVSERPANDLGRYEVTQDPHDRWKYKTPSLRNLALTAPYMHNGSLVTLAEVVELYDRGGVPNPLIDPLIQPLGLSDQEKDDLVTFLGSLTGSNVSRLVADAVAAPVGDADDTDPRWWE
jgi:cytochrome c peroxidase